MIPFHMQYPEQATPDRQKMDWWFPGAGDGKEWELTASRGTWAPFRMMDMFWNQRELMTATAVGELNATEPHTLQWLKW